MKRIITLLVFAAAPVGAQGIVSEGCEFREGKIVCSIRNEGSAAVGELAYSAFAVEKGRAFSWGEVHGTEKIAGGIEPGEDYSLNLPSIELPSRARGRDVTVELRLRPIIVGSIDGKETVIERKVSHFADQVSRCWNRGSLSSEASIVTVVLSFKFDEQKTIDKGSIHMDDGFGGSEAAIRQAFEAARRALLMCTSSVEKNRIDGGGGLPTRLVFSASGRVLEPD